MAGTTTYANTLNATQKNNINILVSRAKLKGITNPLSIGGMLSVISKESAFIPRNEGSYRTTSNERIRAIFGKRVAGYNEEGLTRLKQNDVLFFDVVYGYLSEVGRANGNTKPGDGYKYRGRTYNQVTFKNLYDKIGKQIGVDLVSNPDQANDPEVAADIAIQYFINAFATGKSLGKLKAYNSTGINDFKTLNDSLHAFYHANAGWGKSTAAIQADPTGGLAKAKKVANDLYTLVSDNKAAAGGGLFFLLLLGLAYANRKSIASAINNLINKQK